jgi:hypothetical protein
MKKVFPIFIASATGLTVLAGYFFQARLAPLLGLFIQWGILLAGLAGLIGIGYLLKMHVTRVALNQKGRVYSAVVISTFLFTLAAGFIVAPREVFYRNWVLNIQIPVEASLLAILAVTLLYGSLFIIRTRGWTLMSIGFLVSALTSLFLNLGLVQFQPGSMGEEWLQFIRRLPLAGTRGILIGMALGGLIVGLRVLLAMDRPYNGE